MQNTSQITILATFWAYFGRRRGAMMYLRALVACLAHHTAHLGLIQLRFGKRVLSAIIPSHMVRCRVHARHVSTIMVSNTPNNKYWQVGYHVST